MAVCFPLKEIVVFLCIIEILNADRDLLESIQLNANNPPELNDFLGNVMQHKQVFSWIRHAAREAAHPPSQEEMDRYRSDIRSTRFNKPQSTYNKRNARNRRPINDLHPYLYENDGTLEDRTMRYPLRKRRRQRGFHRSRRSKGSISVSLMDDHDDGEVKVAPRSEAGVLNVPGQKYGGKRGAKRNCEDEYETHERVAARSNASKSNTTDCQTGSEYYFSTPHDVLGLDQDIQKESDNLNETCIQIKREAVRRQDASSTPSANTKVATPSPAFSTIKTPDKIQQNYQNQQNQIYQRQIQSLQQPQMMKQPAQVLQQRASAPISISPSAGLQLLQLQQQPHTQFVGPQQTLQNQAVKSGPNAAVVNDQKGQDFAKLIRFVDAPNKDQQTLSKQDLLKKDNDDVLENIDRILKSDRTGLNLFHNMVGGVSFNGGNAVKKDENKDANNQNRNEAAKVKRYSEAEANNKEERNANQNDNKPSMDVDITLNAQPVSEFVQQDKKKSNRRRINIHKKKVHASEISLNPGSNRNSAIVEQFPKIDQQTSDAQQQMLADPNLKIMENADDENNDNLKQTLKEYINRQNEYNMEKQPEQEEDSVTPNYSLVQEKKNMLEDQTEPTSAAEQRELGRFDNYVTPSLLNDSDIDNTLIVIPLEKSVQNDKAVTSRSGEFDYIKDGFKVKEAKDVIHVRTHHGSKGPVFKKETDRQGFDNTLFTKTVFDKIKDDIEESSRLELGESNNLQRLSTKEKHTVGDYSNDVDYPNGIKDKEDKIDPSKQSNADYGEYENFELKRRDVPSSIGSFKSRKLKWLDEEGPYDAKFRTKRQLNYFEARNDIDKRSEDDEPDEEPGNDAKDPVEPQKKVQKASKSIEFAPKKEEGEMTLHMDAGGDMKRNDTNNDYPPDDENEPPKFANGNRTAPQVITYNYFNISVNLVSTTTPSSDSDTTCASGSSAPIEDSQSSSDQPPSESPNEVRSTQFVKLAEDIMNYTSKDKDKSIDATFPKEEEKLDYKEKDVKVEPKEIDEDDTDDHPYSKNQVDLNAVKQILTEDEDNVSDKNVERSVDHNSEAEMKKAEHSVRNAVDEAKHREMLVNKLERLVNSYKSQVQHIADTESEGLDNIDKRSNEQGYAVHHHPHEKKVPQLPRPDCADAPMVKHVLHNPNAKYVKPQEIYYEPESMADDLKEKLLFHKIYNRVVRRRKKEPDPFMYKLIDSVFGNDEDEQMCPLDQSEGTAAKRTDTNQDSIQRQKKKTQNADEIMEEDLKNDNHNNVIKKEVDDESKGIFDDVDSFKDVIEVPNRKGLRKRELSRNLEDFPNSYLSPVNEGFAGEGKQRLRRRLKYLQKSQKKKVRQINYDDYVQTHGLGPKRLTSNSDNKQSGQGGNFNKGQNFNVKDQINIKESTSNATSHDTQALKGGEVSSRIVTASTPRGVEYKITEKNCSELEDIKSNHSKMVECEERKKEHEDMRKMLNGFLPLKIMDIFYDRLKENGDLFNRFSGSISNSKQCASENAHNVKLFREEQAKIDIKHAEGMLHEVIIMLNQIVADQVHRRTCLQLAPNLKIFVIRITKNLRNMKKNDQVAEGYPLPKIKSRSGDEVAIMPPEEEQGDFLFGGNGGSSDGRQTDEKSELNKKIKLIEKLLEKYQSMSMRCQVQVEPVKDYLLKHLGMLMKLLEKAQESSTCATTTRNQEPMVREEELEPPGNNVSIKTVALPPPPRSEAVSTTISAASANAAKQLEGQQESEVSQRQRVMLHKQQEEEENRQQLLQRQIQEQEIMQRMQEEQERLQRDQYQQQPSQIQEIVQQQMRPLAKKSEQDGSIVDSDNDNSKEIVQSRGADSQSPAKTNQQLQPVSVGQRSVNTPQSQQHQTPSNNQGNTSSAVTALVQKELDPLGQKYTNPETVTKDLLALGLDIANSYLPPFDLNRMVQEKMIKADIDANNAGQLIPHVSAPPPPQNPTKQGSPKKRDVLGQGFGYDAKDLMRSPPSDAAPQKPATNTNQNAAAASKVNFDPSKIDYANYGRNQFILQPLLIDPTQVPDPDVEDTEYFSGQKYTDPNLVNKDLVELGLDGEINSYVMPFTLNGVVQAQQQADAKHVAPKIPITMPPATILTKTRRQGYKSMYNVSDEYRKLMDTYRSVREKRQNEERIGKLYGVKPINDKMEDLKAVNKEMHDLSKVSFEKPIVFSLEG